MPRMGNFLNIEHSRYIPKVQRRDHYLDLKFKGHEWWIRTDFWGNCGSFYILCDYSPIIDFLTSSPYCAMYSPLSIRSFIDFLFKIIPDITILCNGFPLLSIFFVWSLIYGVLVLGNSVSFIDFLCLKYKLLCPYNLLYSPIYIDFPLSRGFYWFRPLCLYGVLSFV